MSNPSQINRYGGKRGKNVLKKNNVVVCSVYIWHMAGAVRCSKVCVHVPPEPSRLPFGQSHSIRHHACPLGTTRERESISHV